jgi:hypothetical protein
MKRTVAFLVVLLQVHFALADGIARPTPPTYENCTSTNQLVYNQDCMSRNQALEAQYNLNMNAYNEAVRLASQEVPAASADTTGTTGSTASATALLADAQKINQNASAKNNNAATLCTGASLALAAAFAVSCIPPSTCIKPLLYGSMAFAAFSILAKSQAKSHDAVAEAACKSQAQLTSSSVDCSNATSGLGTTSTSGTNPTGTTSVSSVFTPAGTCVPGQEATCNTITSSLPPGTNIRDVTAGVAAFASGKKTLPYTVNPDGSITTKDGKKLSASDFTNPSAMVAAGLSQVDANALASNIKKSGIGADGLIDSKSALAAENAGSGSSSGGSDLGPNGAPIKVGENVLNGDVNAVAKDALAKNKSASREPSSAEGLVKDFNGELIGASGDDIFKMMNRRYNLKVSQDSFIGP